MISTEKYADFRVKAIAAWLDEKGFGEAAVRLLEASDEIVQRVGQAEDAEWLYYQHELKQSH